jgi:hypothetical protein
MDSMRVPPLKLALWVVDGHGPRRECTKGAQQHADRREEKHIRHVWRRMTALLERLRERERCKVVVRCAVMFGGWLRGWVV